MNILVTGANGFIAKNLIISLKEKNHYIYYLHKNDNIQILDDLIKNVDFIYHLAGVNRVSDASEYTEHNQGLTEDICMLLEGHKKNVPIVLSSSTQAAFDNAYGKSKLASERAIQRLIEKKPSNTAFILRLTNVFGKWAKPNYNSVVATFCHNIAMGLPIEIHDGNKLLTLTYIDDLIAQLIDLLDQKGSGINYLGLNTKYEITVQTLAEKIKNYKKFPLILSNVGRGFDRALYSTYLSYLNTSSFSEELNIHEDSRGKFVEILKTENSGQFSFLTIHPNIVRGGHYHHTKNEKFLVVKGCAKFRFKNIINNEYYEIDVTEDDMRVVKTIPGWAHTIENTGKEEAIVFLWANEIFDSANPDTYKFEI